jgi:site-specific DNA recombinase
VRPNKPLRSDILEDVVWADVCSLLADPRRVEQEYERRLAIKSEAGFGQSVEQMQRQIGKLKRGMSRIADAYEEGWLDKAEFEQRMSHAKDQLIRLEAQQVQVMCDEESSGARCDW